MFAFSVGMGVLLLAVGTFSGMAAALPKPGAWMVVVKKVLGLLMLVLAEYYLVKAGQVWLGGCRYERYQTNSFASAMVFC